MNKKPKLMVMPQIKLDYRHLTDVIAIRDAMVNLGYDACLSDIEWAWAKRSEEWCAGWLFIENAEDAAREVIERLIPAEEL